jgi:DNA (cytosine-5)-methyltransferase 1
MLRVLDLFSGLGAFSYGLELTGGFRTVGFCEIEPFARHIIAKHWPDVPCHHDITEREFIAGEADVVCGGFPCQDVSQAGLGAGLAGERSGLWRELLRAIRVVRPRFAIVENVAALLDRGLGEVLGDLAEIGHDAEWHCIPASAVGAEHERDRVWIVSHPDTVDGQAGLGLLPLDQETLQRANDRNRHSVWLASTLPPPGVADGSAAWVDRRERTEALGNAVVPQIPEMIGRAILAAESERAA